MKAFGLAVALVACSSDDAATATDAATDAAMCQNGDPCDREGNGCTGVSTCRSCGFESYVREAPRCICKSAKWVCTLTDCGPFTPSTFVDPECKTRRDAGVPDTSTPADTTGADGGEEVATDAPSDG